MIQMSTSGTVRRGVPTVGMSWKKKAKPINLHGKPTQKQIKYIRTLCSKTGESYYRPKTSKEASSMIETMKDMPKIKLDYMNPRHIKVATRKTFCR